MTFKLPSFFNYPANLQLQLTTISCTYLSTNQNCFFPAIFNPYKCITENKLHAFLFLSHSYNSNKETTKLTSPLLRHIQEHGNTTVYHWRTGKVPSVCCICCFFSLNMLSQLFESFIQGINYM